MSTFINLGIVSLNSRLDEIDIILDEAELNIDHRVDMYNALCRSAQVLLCAHFEGYLKDLVRNSIDDINRYSSFARSNESLKRIFCEHFIILHKEDKNSKSKNHRVKEMIAVFDGLDTKFNKDYFSYNVNQNPKITVLEKIAEQYGIKKVFKQLSKSMINSVFSNSRAENILLRDKLKTEISGSTSSFPYTLLISFLEISPDESDFDNLWDSFISDLLKRRHDIAHGRQLISVADISQIRNDRIKIEILLYAFTFLICLKTNPSPL